MYLERSYVATCLDADPGQRTLDLSWTMVAALARAMSAHDRLTYEHAQRVQRYALVLAREAGISDAPLLEAINIAALLHDIGKLGIPNRLLNKPALLTSDEYDQVKQHAVIGAEILSAAAFPDFLALLVRHHHENWDSTGYPDGIRGEAIPLGARVLAIADCYDALTSDRPYRAALSHASAMAMIQQRRGSMYDADLVDAFLRIVERTRFGPARTGAVRGQSQVNSPWLQKRAV